MRVTIENDTVFVTDAVGNELYQYDGEGEALNECDERAAKGALFNAIKLLNELPVTAAAPRKPLRWMSRGFV